MRLAFTTILLIACFAMTYAQRFEVAGTNKNYKVSIGQKISTPLKIKNLTDEPINLVIRRIDKSLGTSQKSFFCLSGECFDEEIEQLPAEFKVPAGEVSLQFENVFESGLVEGYGSVKYLVYDRDKPTEAIELEITYSVEDKTNRELIYNSEELKINDLYPNPVVDFAIVDYNILNSDVDAKILIHNVLGSIVGEYKLNPLEDKLTIKTHDFNAGVYFYTLYIDAEGMLTRKLIIRK